RIPNYWEFSRDGNWLLASEPLVGLSQSDDGDGVVAKVWDLRSEKEFREVTFRGLTSLYFIPQGRWLVGLEGRQIVLFDTHAADLLQSKIQVTSSSPKPTDQTSSERNVNYWFAGDRLFVAAGEGA